MSNFQPLYHGTLVMICRCAARIWGWSVINKAVGRFETPTSSMLCLYNFSTLSACPKMKKSESYCVRS